MIDEDGSLIRPALMTGGDLRKYQIEGLNWLKVYTIYDSISTWMKVFRTIPEFRILRLTLHRKSASKF